MVHNILVFAIVAASFAAGTMAIASNALLADAAEKQDLPQVRLLLTQKTDANAPQPDGMTALLWAAHLENVELSRLLIEAGADVSATNRYGVSPLSLACRSGNAEQVKLFLNSGADPNSVLRGDETALMTASRTGRTAPVKALLAHGADVNAKERRGQTALMWAASEGHTQVVQLLIDAGADFRTPLRNSGYTPLSFAVRDGRVDVVDVLLAAGADINEPIDPKRSGGDWPRKGMSPLLLAVENGHFELALDLIAAGADPDDMRSGFTPLHTMTWVRKPNMGEDEDGDPPPRGSGEMTSLEFVRELVKSGADVNSRLERGNSGRERMSYAGATTFLLASSTADIALLKLLVELGADPTLGNEDNCTPLMATAGVGTKAAEEVAGTEPEAIEVATYLLELGADVNAVDANGETVFHGAAYKNFPGMIRFLAAQGASAEIINSLNKYKRTPWHIAHGYRMGNFKPSADTIQALHDVMLDVGIDPAAQKMPKRIPNYSK